MKTLITGSNGFLGTALVERLLSRGETGLRCMVRAGSKRARLDAVLAQYSRADVEIFVGALSSREQCRYAVKGVDRVFHVAAAMSGTAADMFQNSVVATRNLLDAIVDTGGIRLIAVSSFGVYGVADLPRGTVVNESTPLETCPQKRDLYSYAKLRQEQLCWEYQEKYGLPLTVIRPGVIYGPNGSPMSSRVGLNLFGLFLHLGGGNRLPLTYVENCAEAIAHAGSRRFTGSEVFNIVDDDIPTCSQYLKRYKREVRRIKSIRVPYAAAMLLSRMVESYSRKSRGQLPAVFTPYKTATAWKGNRFDNSKLKGIGWKQVMPTSEALALTFKALKARGEV